MRLQALSNLSSRLRYRPRPFLVLIDADNLHASLLDPIMEEAARIGQNWTATAYCAQASRRWREATQRHGVELRIVDAIPRKNSVDICIVIDAVALIAKHRSGTLLVASSDADFLHLARHAEASGWRYHGLGETHTSQAYRDACSHFLDLGSRQALKKKSRARKLRRRKALRARILKALPQLADHKGWTSVPQLGAYLAAQPPNEGAKAFGYKSLSQVLRTMDQVELCSRDGQTYAQLKESAASFHTIDEVDPRDE